ncbi:MAG: multicopper oxidase domain-containing protein, partial [bacterium]
DVEFVAWNPGVWRFHCHKLHHLVNAHADVPMGVMPHGGMFTLIHVIPKDPASAWKHPKQKG